MIEFFVLGDPAPKPAPRAVMRDGKGRALARPRMVKTGKKIRQWESCVRAWAWSAMEKQAYTPFIAKHEIESMLLFGMTRPASHYTGTGKLKTSAPMLCNRKPDLDNLVKATMDALEGICFDNDSRIVKRDSAMVYADKGQPPGCYVLLKQIEEVTAANYTMLYHHTLQRFGAENIGVISAG